MKNLNAKWRIVLPALLIGLLPSGALAQIIMEGDYVRTGISRNGTLGYSGSLEPGLRHDPTGNRNWGAEDYLTPGAPWEVFSVKSLQTGLRVNNNTSPTGGQIATTSSGPFAVAGSIFDQHVRWEGALTGFFTISHDYYFNDNFERIDIQTTLTAITDLTDVRFLRAIDPDPDANTHGSFNTINTRGAPGIAPEDFVNSQGPVTGLTLGLYSTSPITHNTGISAAWSHDPDPYLAGIDNGTGDNVIGLAFAFGNLSAGQSQTINYSYVMGGSLDTVDLPISAVPEPSTYGAIGAILLLGLIARRRFQAKKAQE